MSSRQPRNQQSFSSPVLLRPDPASRLVALPRSPNPLLGRDAELAWLSRLLWESETRLITLIGHGGVGKTRLALAAAERAADHFADGAHFVDLAPLRDPALVPSAVAAALGVPEPAARPVAAALADYLRDKDLLLLLDNCEQVAEAATAIADWLVGAPGLVILATSRAPLRIRWEQSFPVEPLALPLPGSVDPAQLGQSPAVALFVARAQAVAPGFALTAQNAPAVAELCRRLDGLPLAIELVALQARLLAPQAILARLVERQALPTATWSDLPARQRTLHDTIAWSYDLLTPTEQSLFRRLAVFVGGWDFAAAESVCGDAVVPEVVAALLALADLSLVRQVRGADAARFTMLETVREYAAAQLAASAEAATIARRHADYFLGFAARRGGVADQEGETEWLARLYPEVDNFRAALYYHAATGQVAAGLRLALELKFFWQASARSREGYIWTIEKFADHFAGLDPTLLTDAYWHAASLAYNLGDYQRTIEHANVGLALLPASADPERLWQGLNCLGMGQRMLGEHNAARETLLRALSVMERTTKRAARVASVLTNLAGVEFDQGDFASAAARYEEVLALARQGHMHVTIPYGSINLAVARIMQGDLHVRELLEEGLVNAHRQRLPAVFAFALAIMALLATAEREFARTATLLGAAEVVRQNNGLPVPAAERPYHARMADAARQALGDATFGACWARGRSWTLDEVVAYALSREELPVPPAAGGSPQPGIRPPVALSRREREVLQQLAAGHTNRKIADLLSIGERTVETHVGNIAAKFDVANRVQIVVQARTMGLI